MPTFIIKGKRYGAANQAQALFAHRKAMQPKAIKPTPFVPNKAMDAPRLARTQPYYNKEDI